MEVESVALMPGATRGVAAALRAGQPREAERLARELLRLGPANAEIRFLLGVAHSELGQARSALFELSAALALDPAFAAAHLHRGKLWQEGRSWTAAIESLRRALVFDPRALDAWFRLAACLMKVGRSEQSRAWLERLVERWPTHGQSFVLLGVLSRQGGRMAAANACLDRAIALEPGMPDGHFERALSAFAADDHRTAESALRRTLALDPDRPHGWLNLGIVSRKLGDLDRATVALAQARRLAPDMFEVHHELGLASLRLGRTRDAADAFHRARALRPTDVGAHRHLGVALSELESFPESESAFRHAVELEPASAPCWFLLGACLTRLSRLADTAACYHRSLALRPAHADVHYNLAKLFDRQGDAHEALCHYRHAVQLDPDHVEAGWELLLAMTADAAAHPSSVLRFQQSRARRLTAVAARHFDNRPDPDRRLRIGYVGRSYSSVVNDLTTTALRACDAQRTVQVMFAAPLADPDFRSQRDGFEQVVDVTGLDDAETADAIRRHGIDVLVDMDAWRPGNRLGVFARQPAPVQATWIEAFYTTGLSQIEYLVTDAVHIGSDERMAIVETPVRLPDSRFCYAPPYFAPAAGEPPCLTSGWITFGSFNALNKLTPAVIALWSEILHAVPGSRLLLKRRNLDHAEIRDRYMRRFADRGIGADRVIMRGHSPHREMLAEYGDVDIALDPFPYNGGRSSCEALWMGVPLVALRGDRMVARQSASILGALGRAEWIAGNPADYREIAVALALDPSRLARLRRDQRALMRDSPLCDARRFARNLEQAYRWMWRRWCAR
ncbi:MAG: tetratricopeptide repeat protein [Alphaproteobacteria bacterium]|nr:tetratricopeptide repeat protein [Alphaproteobacteria bacterium]